MSRQAWGVDIHEYYRTGGINWDQAAEIFDFIGIRACVGEDLDELYLEHIEEAEKRFSRIFTYQAFDPRISPLRNISFYLSIPKVKDHPRCGDVEPVGGQMVSESQARSCFDLLDESGDQGWYYSNYNYTSKLGFPLWIKNRVKFWAEYPIDILTFYNKIERYLEKNPWKVPKWAARIGYIPEIHQFTKKGDARYYLANEKTDDPDFPNGIKSADLIVSLIGLDELDLLFNVVDRPATVEERLTAAEADIKLLKGFHGI